MKRWGSSVLPYNDSSYSIVKNVAEHYNNVILFVELFLQIAFQYALLSLGY